MFFLVAGMYEDLKEYLNWYDTRRDTRFAADAPVIGLVLQRSHLVTGDEGHYAGVVSELEAQGAKASLMSLHMTTSSNLLTLHILLWSVPFVHSTLSMHALKKAFLTSDMHSNHHYVLCSAVPSCAVLCLAEVLNRLQSI